MHPERRRERRAELMRLLGEWPAIDRAAPPSGELLRREDGAVPGAVVEHWRLDLNGFEPVPAVFCRPADAAAVVPAVLYHHYHNGEYATGKDELVRDRGTLMQSPAYAHPLAAMGVASLAIDCWGFGERREGAFGRTESAIAKRMLWDGRSMWGMMMWDAMRSLDWLCARPDVDAARIGTMGLSMGSTLAWWTAALDERVRVCVDLCCATDYEALIDDDGLDRHGIYYYSPGLLRAGFTAGEIGALAAPRARLSCNGTLDSLTPEAGLQRLDAELRVQYAFAGAPDHWRMHLESVGHGETPTMRQASLDWLRRHLL